MEYTKPLFMRMRNLSDEAIESIINASTFEDEANINVVRGKAKKFFQSYQCYLNNNLSEHANIVIEQYTKKVSIKKNSYILLQFVLKKIIFIFIIAEML